MFRRSEDPSNCIALPKAPELEDKDPKEEDEVVPVIALRPDPHAEQSKAVSRIHLLIEKLVVRFFLRIVKAIEVHAKGFSFRWGFREKRLLHMLIELVQVPD